MEHKGGAILCSVSYTLLLSLLMQGCSQKDQMLYQKIEQNAPRLKALQQTEKMIFHKGEEEEIILLIVYLPKKDASEESFIVAGSPSKSLTIGMIRQIRLAGYAPQRVQSLSRKELSSTLRREIPSWFALYRLSYPPSDLKKMPLTLKVGAEEKRLYFYKGPKYLIDKVASRSF